MFVIIVVEVLFPITREMSKKRREELIESLKNQH